MWWVYPEIMNVPMTQECLNLLLNCNTVNKTKFNILDVYYSNHNFMQRPIHPSNGWVQPTVWMGRNITERFVDG